MRVVYYSDNNKTILEIDDTSLELSYRNITSIEFENYENSMLQTLYLSGNQLTNIDKVNWPQSLQTLHLYHNQLINIDKINWPQSLQTLNLSSNQLTNIDKVNWPQSLQTLNLSCNQLINIDKVNWPQSLRTLYLSGNQLANINIESILLSCKEKYNKNVIKNTKILPLYKVLQDLTSSFLIR